MKEVTAVKSKVWFVLLLIVALLVSIPALANEQNTFTVQVQATGVVYVPPTKAQMWVGAKTDGPTAAETLTKSNAVMQKIIGIAQEFTAPELVRTSEFNMYQNERWDEVSQKSIPEGFTLRHVFEVQIQDLTNVAPFLDQVTQAGANIIYGLQYGVQDYRTPREEAFKQAMDEAWWKAGLLAEANQAQHLILDSVEESYFYGGEFDTRGVSVGAELADSLMPGQLQIAVTILAKFRAELPK
jgi:uncharacterized protein YggE